MSFDADRNVGGPVSLEEMARYFFHTDNGVAHRDADGLELLTEQEAGLEAARFLGELLAQQPDAFWSSEGLTVTVTDRDERVAFALQARVIKSVSA